ncbi:MAG: multifunctional CCA addition/repair protein [Sulfuricaulis sp.]
MKIYLVGGAVRDQRLGLPIQDRDYVVVGATPEEMVAKGFKPVGADFPVFLHPQTKAEYALARTERKSGRGYKGFTVYAAPDVTLEDDLRRRDLTINAMAEDEHGNLIDPFQGAEDLRHGVLRHVSPAFPEDPVRILRVARFAARFAKWGFHVAHATNQLMRQMADSGELDHLVAERVWAELVGAIGTDKPSRFFAVLHGCGALARLFPEIDASFGASQPQLPHAPVDSGAPVMRVLDAAAKLSPDPRVRFAALMHNLGQDGAPKPEPPAHHGRDERAAELVKNFCRRWRVPNEFRDLAVITARCQTHCHQIAELGPATVIDTLDAMDAFRRPERVDLFVTTCEADFRGRTGVDGQPYAPAELFRRLFQAARMVDTAAIAAVGSPGPETGARIREARIAAVRQVLSLPDSVH